MNCENDGSVPTLSWTTALTDLPSEVIVYPFLSKQNTKILNRPEFQS